MVTEERLLQTAFHESGHIIFTYLTGYSCDGCELLDNADGKTSLNFGSDLLLITGITNCIEEPEIYNGLDRKVKAHYPVVSHRIIRILLAGSIVESVFLNGGVINDNMEVEVSGPDLIRANNVNQLLFQIKKEKHDPNYIQNTMSDLFVMISIDEMWNPISKLAKELANKRKLKKQEIEEILNITGFFEFIKTV
ncbi:MAG: hypothetical protein PHT07_19460 [Paludibacter sp.]|nr:hypothetical protein [Paludibacter sp.]